MDLSRSQAELGYQPVYALRALNDYIEELIRDG